ncbi:hypothetical protein SDC9_158951 [bioreactor metagenome]|uniref:Uncharacterized protein n=1 Tax=bioreactor metagenome TaxID=1076179 RepID=A0A645FBK7_9ZZZZ
MGFRRDVHRLERLVAVTQFADALAGGHGRGGARVREELGLVVVAAPQREQRCASQLDGVLDVVAGRLQPKRVGMAGAFEHEEDADRVAAHFDAGISRIGCRCLRHLSYLTVGFSAMPSSGHWPVLSMNSSNNPGGMARSPASHCCHPRIEARTVCAASVCVSPTARRALRMASGVGL